ncbi:MAG: hypothetical protein ACXWP1_11830, partial [Bdellovibrionota bacterium]
FHTRGFTMDLRLGPPELAHLIVLFSTDLFDPLALIASRSRKETNAPQVTKRENEIRTQNTIK